MRRRPARWATPFAAWVSDYGVGRLRTELACLGQPVTQGAIYSWLSGRGTPRLPLAIAVVSISRGAVTAEDIVRHRETIAPRTGTPP